VFILQFQNVDKVKAWQDNGAQELQQKAGAKYADFQYVVAVEATESSGSGRGCGCARAF